MDGIAAHPAGVGRLAVGQRDPRQHVRTQQTLDSVVRALRRVGEIGRALAHEDLLIQRRHGQRRRADAEGVGLLLRRAVRPLGVGGVVQRNEDGVVSHIRLHGVVRNSVIRRRRQRVGLLVRRVGKHGGVRCGRCDLLLADGKVRRAAPDGIDALVADRHGVVARIRRGGSAVACRAVAGGIRDVRAAHRAAGCPIDGLTGGAAVRPALDADAQRLLRLGLDLDAHADGRIVIILGPERDLENAEVCPNICGKGFGVQIDRPIPVIRPGDHVAGVVIEQIRELLRFQIRTVPIMDIVGECRRACGPILRKVDGVYCLGVAVDLQRLLRDDRGSRLGNGTGHAGDGAAARQRVVARRFGVLQRNGHGNVVVLAHGRAGEGSGHVIVHALYQRLAADQSRLVIARHTGERHAHVGGIAAVALADAVHGKGDRALVDPCRERLGQTRGDLIVARLAGNARDLAQLAVRRKDERGAARVRAGKLCRAADDQVFIRTDQRGLLDAEPGQIDPGAAVIGLIGDDAARAVLADVLRRQGLGRDGERPCAGVDGVLRLIAHRYGVRARVSRFGGGELCAVRILVGEGRRRARREVCNAGLVRGLPVAPALHRDVGLRQVDHRLVLCPDI